MCFLKFLRPWARGLGHYTSPKLPDEQKTLCFARGQVGASECRKFFDFFVDFCIISYDSDMVSHSPHRIHLLLDNLPKALFGCLDKVMMIWYSY